MFFCGGGCGGEGSKVKREETEAKKGEQEKGGKKGKESDIWHPPVSAQSSAFCMT